MEWIVLLGIAAVIGIPAIAILAYLQSKEAAKQIAESCDTISGLESDLAGLRREFQKLSGRVAELEAVRTAPDMETRHVSSQSTPMHADMAPVETAASNAITTPLVENKEGRGPATPSPAAHGLATPSPVAYSYVASSPISPGWSTPPVKAAPPSSSAPSPATPPSAAASFATHAPAAPREDLWQRLRTNLPLEQFLGMNLFARIGIVLLVLGLALLGRIALIAMGPELRVTLTYATAGLMLGGGIWLEGRERYRLLGHAGIGGGWALLFFTTYAMHHVAPMTVMRSNTLDCVLMLIVAAAMVAHTLRYRSQLVTGLAFLLAFSTVALSQDTVYSLVAGVILVLGIAAIALRMSWFELEIFGILASYGNHFYWLYRLYPNGTVGHAFPQFWPSAIILVLYWAAFRISYVARKVTSPLQESYSTIAALANTMLLLAVMKFQSTHPELAFYALLGIGALEFLFGQLPITRRRPAAFTLLTVLGTLLIFAAVPFKFSGNNIALFWMIAAEVLLIAGIAQREMLFRRLGLIAGGMTGMLIVMQARGILTLSASSETPLLKDGILLLTASALFYANALYLRGKWRELFDKFDSNLAEVHSYLGAITAFLSVWAFFPSDWTAIGWAAMLLGAAFGARRLKARGLEDRSLLWQAWALACVVILRAAIFNWHIISNPYPHHMATRLITLPLLALVFYGTWWILDNSSASSRLLRSFSLWSAAALFAALVSAELPAIGVAPAFGLFALLLFEVGVRAKQKHLRLQAYALLTASFAGIFLINLSASARPGEILSPRIYTVLPLTLIYFYLSARLWRLNPAPGPSRWPMSNLMACFGTASIVALLYVQIAPAWIIVSWSLVVAGLIAAALLLDKEVFLEQTALLTSGIVLRGLAYNLAGSGNLFSAGSHGKLYALMIACTLLLATLPLAFRIRNLYRERPQGSFVARYLAARRPEQILFFAPLLLIVATITVKTNPGMITLAWAITGLTVILLGIFASQRSYRLAGITLLLFCITKIVFRDAWHLDERSRYVTFIVLGASLILVSALYSKFRDQMSRLL